ncbi:C-type lectin domain family 4 member M-like [Drosophila elegans]|uniref:C-type lectin domain family 4 member M-like n=1 Tax=Drosophila elegans TaxID=30023 RepID=UPI0007E60D1D|nr:C-type lectin domain family 4 member M-like [Drosophila elegans]
MQKLGSLFFCSFLLLGRSSCQPNDPPNQSGQLCLTTLHPVIDLISETNSKLLSLQSKLDVQGTYLTKEDFETRLNVTEEHIAATSTHAKLTELQESLNKTQDDFQVRLIRAEKQMQSFQDMVLAVLSRIESKFIPPNFEKIGDRYFYIEKSLTATWITAAASCRSMNGFLASFGSEEEFNAVRKQLSHSNSYWLGINDRKKEREFISAASGKPPKFVKWNLTEFNDQNDDDCVSLYRGEMFENSCSAQFRWICQADTEV